MKRFLSTHTSSMNICNTTRIVASVYRSMTTSRSIRRTSFPLTNTGLNQTRLSSGTTSTTTTAAAAAAAAAAPGGNKNHDDVTRIVTALESDSQILEAVLQQMDPESRRRLVIAGGAVEWFGKERVEQEMAKADTDKDKFISPKDFDNWFKSALLRHPLSKKSDDSKSSSDSNNSSSNSTSNSKEKENDFFMDTSSVEKGTSNTSSTDPHTTPVPIGALLLIAFEAGLPFVGFGFLDNATMILAGDMIDQTIGMYLHCSVMASAAMGNVISGMCGMQVHGAVEKVIYKLNLPTPIITEQQRKSQRVFLAGHLGGTIGIACGLILGMLPLLIIRDEEDKIECAMFHTLDGDNDGIISVEELRHGLREVGLMIDSETARELMRKYRSSEQGEEGLNLAQFRRLCSDLKK